MTQKERLVELIADYLTKNRWVPLLKELSGGIADYLLQNGVIVPPCKVGDTVYIADLNCGIIEEHINNVYITMNCDNWVLNGRAFGKTIFSTRETAEQTLKERVT